MTREQQLARLANAHDGVVSARQHLRNIKDQTDPAIVTEFAPVEELEAERLRYVADAKDNADNVTANRVAEFVKAVRPNLEDMARRWAFMRGLTEFDVQAMLARIIGKPRPIVIEPEPSTVPFFEDEDLT